MSSRTSEGKNFAAIHPNKQSFVVCAGVIYGLGEEYCLTLNHIFNQGWNIGEDDSLKIIGEGNNIIPTIHIKDLAKMIGKIIYGKVDINEIPYFLAVDKSGFEQTQINIIKAIGDYLDINKIDKITLESLKNENMKETFEPMTVDIKITLSPKLDSLMEDSDWHCKEGLVANIGKVFEEFKASKGFRSLRVLLIGPPLSGKSKFSAM